MTKSGISGKWYKFANPDSAHSFFRNTLSLEPHLTKLAKRPSIQKLIGPTLVECTGYDTSGIKSYRMDSAFSFCSLFLFKHRYVARSRSRPSFSGSGSGENGSAPAAPAPAPHPCWSKVIYTNGWHTLPK